MRILHVTHPGGPDALMVGETTDPVPHGDQVIVAVHAAGVNHADLLQRAGRYPSPPGAPSWPGLEVSGEVVAVGPDATWQVGARVAALVDGGGYAELVAVRSGQVLPAPATDLVDAAALPEAACTVWSSLVTAAGLRARQTVLVHGGSGGIGTVAIQIAVALGARVIATAGGPERTARCAALGADVVVDHRTQDFVEVARAATGGRGVDVVLDVVGGAYLGRNVEVLATGGRLSVIGLQRGARGELNLGALLAKQAAVIGTMLRPRPYAGKAAIVADVVANVWPMVADGRVRPVVHARIPLAEGARAHDLLESGDVFGKLVLIP